MPRVDLRRLARLTENEGKRLAKRVRDGEVTRAAVEASLEEFGDGECVIALQWLDRWGIK